jgi:TonB family protein
MFENSSSWQRFKSEKTSPLRGHMGYVPELDSHEDEERKGLRFAIALAVVAHLIFFVLNWPEFSGKTYQVGSQDPVYVVQQIRFQPPPPAQQKTIKPQEKRKKIPIPDPTPEDPEPIVIEEIDLPETELIDLVAMVGIPEGPPSLGADGSGPVAIGGGIKPPIKTYDPPPRYTEEARQGQIQGVVILEAVIDREGNIPRVKVLKGLPSGLTDSAVETVKQWKYKPATLEGKPVAVFMVLTISFSLQ